MTANLGSRCSSHRVLVSDYCDDLSGIAYLLDYAACEMACGAFWDV